MIHRSIEMMNLIIMFNESMFFESYTQMTDINHDFNDSFYDL